MRGTDEQRARTEAHMKEDYLPHISRTESPNAEVRKAEALEYIAYHIGQIDKKLDALTEAMKLLAGKM